MVRKKKEVKRVEPKIVDVKISFAFSHTDASKRFTWKAGRGSSLFNAILEMALNRYNYWQDGEKESIVSQLKELKFATSNELLFPKVVPAQKGPSTRLLNKLKKDVAKDHPREDN